MLIQKLLEKKIIDKQKATSLEYEVKNANKTEEGAILDSAVVSEDFLFGLKSELLKIPLKLVSPEEISLKALETIPEESAKYYQMIPLSIKDSHLEVGMVYPDDLKAREALEFLTRQEKYTYQVYLITPSNFENLFRKYRNLKKEVVKALEELEGDLEKEKKGKSWTERAAEVEKIVEEAPISKVVAVILKHAVDGNASDVHIEPIKDKVRVRFRLDGILHSSIFLPFNVLPAIVARVKILSNLKIDETRVPQDGRFSAKIEGRDIDFRVSTFPTSLGEKIVIRVLDSSKREINLESLGIAGRNLRLIQKALDESYGMILSTGPTGSGKTTTLYAMLGILNKDDWNIITLEDPIEYFMEGINQSQIRPEIGYTFATGLRSILRQDPDIIMVGEIRDSETASLAVHASLTGHIVLSTLHTSNALGVIPRLIDMGVEPFLIPPTLSIAIAQRLARKLCPFCRKKVSPSPEAKKIITDELGKIPEAAKKEVKIPGDIYIYEPVGCKRCSMIGYSGRVGIFEILEMTSELAQIILKNTSEAAITEEAKKQGMITMKQDGVLKAIEGTTSLEEVLRVAEEK
ncbi:MAG: GspE/PulE family protein [Candidatus Nealsonbacteria bacterium]|nr:GspE/PulE family protein [Candidatus Nealsonbacteria bacterium]